MFHCGFMRLNIICKCFQRVAILLQILQIESFWNLLYVFEVCTMFLKFQVLWPLIKSIKIEAENLGIKGLFTQSGLGAISEGECKWLQYLSKHYVLYIRKCISWVADSYFIWCITWFLLLLSCNHSMKCLIHKLFKLCSFYLVY